MSGPRGSDPTQWRPTPGGRHERRPLPPQEEAQQAPQSQQQPWWMERPDRPPTHHRRSPETQEAPNYYAPQQNPQYQPPAYPSSPPVEYPHPVDAAPRKRSKGPLLIGGALVIVLIAAAALFGAWKFGVFNGKQLDVNKAQTGVQQILTDPINGYGAQEVSDVNCNNGRNPKAKKGNSFTCEVTVDGAKRKVNVVFEDDDGTYLVDRPR